MSTSVTPRTTAGKLTDRRSPHARCVAKIVTLLLLFALALLLPSGSALASGDVNEATCPNESMTGYSANLPDCRAYEQVSPTEKDDGSGGVFFFDSPVQSEHRFPMQSLADGLAITYPGEPFFGIETKNSNETPFSELYTSERSADGWITHIHDTLEPEAAPTPLLPPPTLTNGYDVTERQVLEETPTGSKVFFMDERDLIPGISNPAPGEPDLYEYTVPTASSPEGRLTDLTIDDNPGPNPGEREHGDAQGIVGIGGEGSEDGDYVYFVAGGTLATGASSGGCTTGIHHEAIGLGCDLYLRHDGVTTFIETLPASDEQGERSEESTETRDWPTSLTLRTAEVSPSGQYLVFGSSMAGLDGGSTEIFRYDAQAVETGEPAIVCVSCSPAGGRALLAQSHNAAINGANRQRYALDNGRVLFTTTQQLVPQDVNHQPDVYEWENGSPHLISAGTSESSPAIFTDAGANGSDIFFTTNQALVPSDQDEITDVYDAREDGGFPPPPPAPCQPEAQCPNGSSTAPVGPADPSLTNTALEPAGVSSGTSSVTPPKATKAELLAKVLRSCKKAHAHSKKARTSCEKQARAIYAPKKKSKPKRKGSK